MLPANVALPPADISRVSAVISEPPSFPAKIISLSVASDMNFKLLSVKEIVPTEVPPSFKKICLPSASKVISPPASI
jgi:hypothetical protein